MTIRRQDDWIASLYAERSDRNLFASQVDFQNFLNHFRDESDYLEYQTWNRIMLKYGIKHLIVPMEEINKSETWHYIGDFMNIAQLKNINLEYKNQSSKSLQKTENYQLKSIRRGIFIENVQRRLIGKTGYFPMRVLPDVLLNFLDRKYIRKNTSEAKRDNNFSFPNEMRRVTLECFEGQGDFLRSNFPFSFTDY